MRTWVLLRGLARESRHWGAFPTVLDRHLPVGDVVVAPDLPGNGRLWREASSWSVEGSVAAVRAQLQAQGFRPPYVLVALSLGGMVALEWAAQARDELEACILINTSVASLSPFWQRMQPRCYPIVLRSLLPGRVAERERAVYAMTSARPLDAGVIDRWVDYAESQPVSPANALRQLVAAARYRASGPLRVPALVLASQGDRLVSPECSRAIARAWRLPLREHPTAGHDLPLDDPGWVVEQVARWWPEHFVRV
jgi:pimeloyl-ACP methyl ester carboxylesterase